MNSCVEILNYAGKYTTYAHSVQFAIQYSVQKYCLLLFLEKTTDFSCFVIISECLAPTLLQFSHHPGVEPWSRRWSSVRWLDMKP